MLDRGYIGTAPAPAERDDESYLDFVEGAKHQLGKTLGPASRARAGAALAAAERSGRAAGDLDAVKAIVNEQTIVKSNNRIARSLQEMMWRETIDTLRKREPELLAELDAADRMGPGSVSYDPAFRYPDYYDPIDFHIQPGSYHRDPLAGHIYHLGTKYFLQGTNDRDELQRGVVAGVPVPADGQVRRILDLACSCGQCTTAFKERFRSAEVWGIDVSAPMVRYAHRRAIDMGIEVHFKQALAEDTGFPDGSFDLVFTNIMFHELPPPVSAQAIRETYRILRPGGLFVFVDIKDRSHLSDAEVPLARYQHDLQTRANGEVYHLDFHYTDFAALARDAGFSSFDNDYRGMGWHPGLVMPMRVATKGPGARGQGSGI